MGRIVQWVEQRTDMLVFASRGRWWARGRRAVVATHDREQRRKQLRPRVLVLGQEIEEREQARSHQRARPAHVEQAAQQRDVPRLKERPRVQAAYLDATRHRSFLLRFLLLAAAGLWSSIAQRFPVDVGDTAVHRRRSEASRAHTLRLGQQVWRKALQEGGLRREKDLFAEVRCERLDEGRRIHLHRSGRSRGACPVAGRGCRGASAAQLRLDLGAHCRGARVQPRGG
mmetsp:Transcript_49509/g.124491  ORF Transcript_49509/g.124491 Transcript_49509/m.124491 type:complete len:228 (-) Transcript_49509:260-943(-)